MFDDDTHPAPGWWGAGHDMAETPPRRVYMDPAPSWERRSGMPVLAYAAGGGAVLFAIGAVVYVKRRDLFRAIVCAALCGACGYGFIGAIQE